MNQRPISKSDAKDEEENAQKGSRTSSTTSTTALSQEVEDTTSNAEPARTTPDQDGNGAEGDSKISVEMMNEQEAQINDGGELTLEENDADENVSLLQMVDPISEKPEDVASGDGVLDGPVLINDSSVAANEIQGRFISTFDFLTTAYL